MKRKNLSLPEIGLIGGTRAALGLGLGLLLADRLETSQRKAIGWTMFGVGLITTVPILAQLLASDETAVAARSPLSELDDGRQVSYPVGAPE
ncbi:MAG TPA: hypothetical protein VHV08_09730 [Pirellulales bacterium]|nr:hypothetical protein [Pirellulales bacterium]